MAASIITIQIEDSPDNNKAKLYGKLTRDGWTVVKRGFKYGATTPPAIDRYNTTDEDGEYNINTLSNLTAYTKYYYKAYADLKFWDVDHWIYETVNGNILFFYTNAEADIYTIIAVDATKTGENESIKFIAYLDDNADSKVSDRGFKYGLTEADTWSVSEAVGAEGTFNLTATGIAGNVDIYFRAFATTPTGNYYGEYEKASTKAIEPVIFMVAQDLWEFLFYLIAYDQNGNIYNAWELTGEYWNPNCICADDDGNTYSIMDETTIVKRTKNGAVAGTKTVVGKAYSIALKPNGYLAVRSLIYGMQMLTEYSTNLNQGGGSMILSSTNPHAYTGLAVDNEGYTYVINRLTNKIEKWNWQEEWVLQDDEILSSDVHIDTEILDLSIDIETGAIITFWEDISLPSPLEEDIGYWAIRTSENHIKIATSLANANAGIAIDITSQGEGRIWIEEVSAKWKCEKVAERDISGVYSGDSSYLSIAGSLIYSNEYGGQGWTIPTTLLEDPTEWTPTYDYIKSLSSLGWNKFLLTCLIEDLQGIACYNTAKELLWENTSYYEMDYYSITARKNFEAEIINIKAEKTAGHLYLYGEITNIVIPIVERGFEYKVQDTEPGEEDTGTEVKETGEFEAEEYYLSSWDTYEDLYRAAENTIWWFRAYAKDDEDNKYTASSWMKNVPTVTTSECTEVEAQQAKGNGELTDKGASESVTGRGFRIIKEYVGDLFGANQYRFNGYTGDLTIEEIKDESGILIGFRWTGDLYRDSEEEGDFDLEEFDRILGGGMIGEGIDMYLTPNDTYKVQAIATNSLGIGFGEEVNLVTEQNILPSENDEIVSEISAEKTITLGTIPEGETVTRIGIRLGRTEGCTDIHVYEDGTWTSGGSHTFYITGFVPGATYYKMPYIILNHGDYEEEIKAIPDYRNPERLEEWLEDYPLEIFPEVEDEDDLNQTITDASVGDISYRTIIKEIKCEKIGDQSFIDLYGRRRSKTITNHLIQSKANCIIIADEYVDKFQILKLKAVIDYDIPIPFEREDVILLGDGKEKYREDTEGLIAFKADGEGEIEQQDFILAKIRKIDSRFVSGSESIFNLELEV